MTGTTSATQVPLDSVSGAVSPLGWRFQGDLLVTRVPVTSLVEACGVARVAAGACEAGTDDLLRIDVRSDAVHLCVATRIPMTVTELELGLVRAVATALDAAGHRCGTAPAGTPGGPDGRPADGPDGGPGDGRAARVPVLELAVDALDIAAVRPFWAALLGYADKTLGQDPGQALVDPAGRLPSLWFQQMDAPRPQRNRIHLDVWIAHDEARARLEAVLAAGGVLVKDTPAFWVVADVEGNEACICTWTPAADASGN